MDFIKQNFPTLLLTLFNLIFVGVMLFIFLKLANNKDAINWGMNAFSGFMGALLGLLTGRALNNEKEPTQKP